MKKVALLLFTLLLLPALSVYAQTGKLTGKVTDQQTGEPLVGANIIVEGTSLGAATNIDGEYIILNVPPGTYTLKCGYIGYQDVRIGNIRVYVGLTTEQLFQLPSTVYETKEISIIAERPLINTNTTNQVSIRKADDIKNLPVRDVNSIISTQVGVVNQGGNIYVRGSRADAVAYYVDGVLVNNPVFGGARLQSINNAIEEIQFQAGGYSAEYGGANAGIVSTQTKTGREFYNFGAEMITDNFTSPGSKFLGTYSFGYTEIALTASGPVLPGMKNLRFFIAANNTMNKTPVGYYQGMDIKNLFDPELVAAYNADPLNSPVPDTFDVYYPDGYIPNNWTNAMNIQGNLTLDLNPLSFRLNMSYALRDGRLGVGMGSFPNFDRAGVNKSYTLASSFKITHVVAANSFYDVIINYFDDYYVSMDPIFKDNITLYGDSLANANVGTTLARDGSILPPLNAYGYQFFQSSRPYNLYNKQSTKSLGGKINFLYQLGQHHELKMGGDLTYYTIRRYSKAPMNIVSFANGIPDFTDYAEVYDRVDNYGYDLIGNETDAEGLLAPKHPIFAAFYLQDKIEYSDLVVNAGLRLDYINTDSKVPPDVQNVPLLPNGEVDLARWVDQEAFMQVSPRLGFSFPVTDQTVFHAQYGIFVQQSRLRDIYQGYNRTATQLNSPFAESDVVGFGLRPERTTQYEIGFRQQLGESFAFSITGFMKDIKDQIQIRQVVPKEGAAHRSYWTYQNQDFSTTKGFELHFELRRTERLALSLDYTYSDARGTGSSSNSSFNTIWQATGLPFLPVQIQPLNFNQTHRGFLSLDYRFADDDGPEIFGSKMLANLGANVMFSFNSGFNYTRVVGTPGGNTFVPLEAVNTSNTPWNFQIDFRVDKSFMFGPLEANIYVWVINVLDTKNVVAVYGTSGDANDDGYLASQEGRQNLAGYALYGPDAVQMRKDLYNALTNYNAGNFGTPRQIRLGIRLNY